MRDQPESEHDWDETVDVLCVGDGPGVLAYALWCVATDREVLIVECADLDPQTAEWRTAMTEDLDDAPGDSDLALIRAEAIPQERVTDRTKLETFVGEALRRWSGQCLTSPFGVMFSGVPDLDPMRTADGESITAGVVGSYRCTSAVPGAALWEWLRGRASGLFAPADDRLAGLVIEDGRFVGVTLDTADGPRRIGTTGGLALGTGAAPEHWPAQPDLAELTVDVAVVSRTAGRFARVELLQR